MNVLSPHISFAALVDFAEDRLPTTQLAESHAHMNSCERCAARLTRLQHTLNLMRSDRMEDAPPHVVRQARQVFRTRRATNTTTGAVADALAVVARRVAALLTFDSREMSPAYGVRSGQPAPVRQLLFSFAEYDLDLRITQRGELWCISGQVLGQCAGGKAELRGATDMVETILNDLCEFTLPPVVTGEYSLKLRLGEVEAEVPQLKLES